MNKKEILEKRKQNILEGYELDSHLAPCIKCFERDEDSVEFELKDEFDCEECLSDTCFVLLEKDKVSIQDPMFV